MKCIILAAGYATRLYPLTENFPKPLLKVGGKAILDWLVDDMAPLIEEFVVISNHRFYEHFVSWAGGKSQKITVLDDGTSSNETRLGAVRDIQFAAEKLNLRDDCVVMAGDNVLEFSLTQFVKYAEKCGASCVMCHEEKNLAALQRTGVIELDEEQRILSFEEKPRNPKGKYAVPPFYFYTSSDLARIGEALDAGCGVDAPGSFASWLSSKTTMHAFIMPGKRYDIGDRKSYEFVRDTYKGWRQNMTSRGTYTKAGDKI